MKINERKCVNCGKIFYCVTIDDGTRTCSCLYEDNIDKTYNMCYCKKCFFHRIRPTVDDKYTYIDFCNKSDSLKEAVAIAL